MKALITRIGLGVIFVVAGFIICCLPVKAADSGIRTIKLRIAADQEFRKHDDWENIIKKRMQGASKFCEDNFGIRLEVLDIVNWESEGFDAQLYKFLADIRKKVPLGDADAVVGFSGNECLGSRRAGSEFFGQYLFVLDWYDKSGKPVRSSEECMLTTVHEILHLFGVWHIEGRSIMTFSVQESSNAVDARTKQYMALMRDYDLKRGVWGLDQDTVKKIIELHSQEYKDDVKDDFPLVQAYLFKADELKKEKKLDEAIGLCRKAIQIFPMSYKAHGELGRYLYNKYSDSKSQPLCDEAIAEQREAVKINPKDGYTYGSMALALCFGEHQYSEAWEAVKKAQGLGGFVSPSLIEFLKTKVDVK
jgi:tetratricopeptide (TPR) repeat protein